MEAHLQEVVTIKLLKIPAFSNTALLNRIGEGRQNEAMAKNLQILHRRGFYCIQKYESGYKRCLISPTCIRTSPMRSAPQKNLRDAEALPVFDQTIILRMVSESYLPN